MKARFLVSSLAAALSLSLASLSGQTTAFDASWAPTLAPVTSPGGSNSTEPQFTTAGDHTILSWLELAGKQTTFKFAERTAAGWSEVRTIASGDDFMVNSADVPSVRRLDNGTMAAHWLQQDGPDPESYKLRLSFSTDEGKSWSAPVYPHHDKVQAQHGFVSLFQAPGAGLGLVWLDGRNFPPEATTGSMALRATVFNANRTQRTEVVVDTRVCECCPTAVAATADGVIVAYRNRSANEIRDIYVTRYAAGRWSMPTRVHADNWRVEACPVNGPAISARGKDVAVAWFTAKEEPGHAFVAFSHDSGRTFAAPVRLDDAASVGRVGVELLSDGSAAATWVEFANEKSEFKVRRIGADGARGPAVGIGDVGGTRYPRLTQHGNELLFAWTETVDGAPHVRTARAPLP